MSPLLARLPERWQQRYRQWLDRRIPPRRSVQFNQRNLFIFLSRQGLAFLLLIALVWVGATNFQNNLAFALSFFLAALLFVTILQTFANASGLRLRFIDCAPVFAGDVALVRIELSSTTSHERIELGWPGQEPVTVSIVASQPTTVALPHATSQRGWQRPGRLRMQTFYPLGIVRCWSWLDLDVQWLVWPAPLEADWRLCCSSTGDEEGGAVLSGGDEYFALKPYRDGEPRSRIAWKQFAAGRGLFVREYADWSGGEVVLDFSILHDGDIESRLSRLCYCALQLNERGRPFGLRLPGMAAIEPAVGDAHLHHVLTALAEYSP